MIKRIISYALVFALVIMSIPFCAIAADDMTDEELIEYYTAKLNVQNRLEGEICMYFNNGVTNEEMYNLMFDVCAFAYGTRDESIIVPNLDYVADCPIQVIIVPDEVIVESMIMLHKSGLVSAIDANAWSMIDEGITGDANNDGEINMYDSIILKRYLMEVVTLTDAQLLLADINSDGEVNYIDYILIKRHCLDLYTIE